MGGVSCIAFFGGLFLILQITIGSIMYVINYFTMVTIQRKPKLLPTHPD